MGNPLKKRDGEEVRQSDKKKAEQREARRREDEIKRRRKPSSKSTSFPIESLWLYHPQILKEMERKRLEEKEKGKGK